MSHLVKHQVFPFLLFEGSMILYHNVIGGDAYMKSVWLSPTLQNHSNSSITWMVLQTAVVYPGGKL